MGASCTTGNSDSSNAYTKSININQLPLQILRKIFNELDNESKWNVIKASKFWTWIFTNTPSLISNLSFEINESNLEKLSNEKELPNVPFRIIRLTNLKGLDKFSKKFQVLLMFLRTLQTSAINQVIVTLGEFSSTDEIGIILKEFKEVTIIDFVSATHIKSQYSDLTLPYNPSLKSLYLFGTKPLFSLFSQQRSVEEIIIFGLGLDQQTTAADFYEFMKKFPNLRSLRLDMTALSLDFGVEGIFTKLQTLKFQGVNFPPMPLLTTVKFSKSGLPNLKELHLNSFQFASTDEATFKHLIEDFNLETFHLYNTPVKLYVKSETRIIDLKLYRQYPVPSMKNVDYCDIPLILNGQKQPVDNFVISSDQVGAIYEMFRQFPTMRKLEVHMTNFTNEVQANEMYNILREESTLFENLKELKIFDHFVDDGGMLQVYVGLLKNCHNLERLAIKSFDHQIDTVLVQCLPRMMLLNDLYVQSDHLKIHGIMAIKNNVPRLRKLSVVMHQMNQAKSIIGRDEIEIIGIAPEF